MRVCVCVCVYVCIGITDYLPLLMISVKLLCCCNIGTACREWKQVRVGVRRGARAMLRFSLLL